MGKTKTAFVEGAPQDAKTGKEGYEERKRKKEEKAKKAQVSKVGLKGGERIKVVTGDIIPEEPKGEEPKAKKFKPKVRGKKYQKAKSKIDSNKFYSLPEAVKLVKDTSYAGFEGSVELHLVTKKDGISEKVTLPHSSGKAKRVEVADDKTLEKIKKGKIDFDVLLATADMMPKLIPFAKILGPRGLMPNPKSGTIIKDKSAESVSDSAQSVILKTQKDAPLIHTVIAKMNQPEKEIEENTLAVLESIGAKNIKKAVLSASMGPGIKLKVA